MADHHPEKNGHSSPHEEYPQYLNGTSNLAEFGGNEVNYSRAQGNFQESHSHDYTKDQETVIEESPNCRYAKLNTILGKGAYKVVYKAIDREEGYETTRAEFNDLSLEIKILKQVRHPNIINFHDCWYKDAEFIFVTELMTSGTLRQWVYYILALFHLKRWSRQILKGLIYLHSHNPPIIHRDIKCDNIFINGAHGEVKIGDMGTAKMKLGKKVYRHRYAVVTNPSWVCYRGTPEFMAPEMYEEKGYSEKVDIYAFGMCLLEMVTGEYPYIECENAPQVYKKVTSGIKPLSLTRVTEPDILDLIRHCLDPENERYTAQQIMEHRFLAVEPEVVLLTADNAKTQLTLQVVFKGMDKLSVKFEFNVEKDTAEQVVNEMIEEKVLKDQYQQLVTHEINRILREINKSTSEDESKKEEHKTSWPSQPITPPFHVGMSPHLQPQRSSHTPVPTPMALGGDSPTSTLSQQQIMTDSQLPPRKNSFSGGQAEWNQEFDDTHPVKEYPDNTPIEDFVREVVLATNKDPEKAKEWTEKLKRQEIETVGNLRALIDEDWQGIGLTIFAMRALKNSLR
ncbi:6772_t:CDS:2, partial [Racocetra persica]